MRICLISEHASPLTAIGGIDSGGQNVYVAQVARHLVALGHRVDVFTRRDDARAPAVVEMAPGLRVLHVDAGPPAFVAKERLLEHMPEFARFCAAWMSAQPRYDVVHANFFMSGWVGLQLRYELGLPLVTTFHALGLVRLEHQKEADAFPPERIAIERRLVAGSDRLIAECPQDEIDLARLYHADPARMTMVPCGFDAGEFWPGDRAQARAALGIPDDEFMVLQLGRMVPRKGVETVVRAMALLPANLRARLRVVGGDCDVPDEARTPEIGRLRAAARACGCSERVVFEGRKTRPELHRWYAAADVFVTVPWYEPFGITPLEAMACGRPVIGSAVGGVRYSVADGETGLLVPPKDEAALARALATLHADPRRAEAMGEAGLARARELFTWERVARALDEVYRAVARPAPVAVLETPAIEVGADAALRPAAATATPAAPAHGETPGLFHIAGFDAPPPAAAFGPGVPAIFLDKDGTLIEDLPYNVDPARVRFAPTAFQALRLWQGAGWRIVVVTNQSGIARGLFGPPELETLHRSLAARLAAEGITLHGFHACPHGPDTLRVGPCPCRKPAPGLLLHAALAHGIDLSRSWMVGDILNDVEAGHRAGCRSALVDVGNETEWIMDDLRRPDLRCATLLEAARETLRLAALGDPPRGTAGATPRVRKGSGLRPDPALAEGRGRA